MFSSYLQKKKVYYIIESCKKKHTKNILIMINNILINTKTKLKELSAIAFANGPGHFTGIRIATSIVQSFSLIFKIPIISISTLVLLAEQAWRKYKKNNILVAIYAQQKKVYWAQYIRNKTSHWIGKETESLVSIKSIEKSIKKIKNEWMLVGDGWKNIQYIKSVSTQNINLVCVSAQDIIPLSLLSLQKKKFLKSTDVKINYLHQIDYSK